MDSSLGHDPGVGTETPQCGGSLSGASQRSRALCGRLSWRNLTPGNLGEVLLKADNEPAIQALVDAVRVKRGERTTVERSPKCSHQSNGAVRECCAKDREPHENLRVCAARYARLQG